MTRYTGYNLFVSSIATKLDYYNPKDTLPHVIVIKVPQLLHTEQYFIEFSKLFLGATRLPKVFLGNCRFAIGKPRFKLLVIPPLHYGNKKWVRMGQKSADKYNSVVFGRSKKYSNFK